MQSTTRVEHVAGHRMFSPESKSVLSIVGIWFPVILDYVLDSAGDEILGIFPANNESWRILIITPTAHGLTAEDGIVSLGYFENAEELCLTLIKHLSGLCAPPTLH